MSKRLPQRPNLDFLRASAKTLLSRLRAGDAEAARTLITHLPEAARMSESDVLARGFRLADAQLALARANGFASWPALARHVETLRSLEGKWGFSSLEIDGATVPAAMLGASFILIDGDRFRMESPEATYEGVFQIDVEASPCEIDIAFNEGPEAGQTALGVFEIEGDSFTLCLGLVGSTRPEKFATAPGSGHALEILTRLAHARPAGVDGGTPPPPAQPSPHSPEAAASFRTIDSDLLRQLQGEWSAIEMISAGQAMDPSFLSFGSRTTIGAETRVVFGGQTMLHARVHLADSALPAPVDYLYLAGQHAGKVAHGLFRWEGEDAVFAIAPAGRPRPSDFASDKANGLLVSRWRRKAPPGV